MEEGHTLSDRVEWIDVLKGIMIVLLVFVNAAEYREENVGQFVLSFFFFFAAGYSGHSRTIKLPVVMKRTFSLLLVFISLMILNLFFKDYINQYVIAFLPALLIVEWVFYLIPLLLKNDNKWIYGIICGFLFLIGICSEVCYHTDTSAGVFVFFVFIGQLFFTVGIYFRRSDFEHQLNKNRWISWLLFLMAGVVALWAGLSFVTVDYPERLRSGVASRLIKSSVKAGCLGIIDDYPLDSFYRLLAGLVVGISAICLMSLVSRFISEHIAIARRGAVFCSKNMLGIAIFHFLFLQISFGILEIAGLPTAGNGVLQTGYSLCIRIIMTLAAVFGSLLLWKAVIRLPFMGAAKGKLEKIIQKFTNDGENDLKENSLFIGAKKNSIEVFALLGLILLFCIPLYRTGIIINDELSARMLAMQGFFKFVKSDFLGWAGQGRLLSALINPFLKYLSFIGVHHGNAIRIGSIIVILGVLVSYGCFIDRLFGNRNFAVFSSVLAVAFLPCVFEHMPPNAFVGFIAFPLMLIFLSFSCFISYIRRKRKTDIVLSMVLFFMSMMSYEALITFTPAYLMISAGKTGLRNINKNRKLYILPCLMSAVYLIVYFGSRLLFPSHYSGNQLGVDGVKGPLKILLDLFIASMPGIFVLFPRYQHYKEMYYNLSAADYIRIILFVALLAVILLGVFKSFVSDLGKGIVLNKSGSIYLLVCGLLYMIIPSLPNSIAASYQGHVWFFNGFFALPVTFYEFFAAIFVFSYLVFLLVCQKGRSSVVIVTCFLCIVVANVQEVNDICSKEQNRNFNRLLRIEAFLKTDTLGQYAKTEFDSPDLYRKNNLLAIHDNYWSDYCNEVLHRDLCINKTIQGSTGKIFYDDDNFVIVDSEKVVILSEDQEKLPKTIQRGEKDFILIDFQNDCPGYERDNGFYVYNVN